MGVDTDVREAGMKGGRAGMEAGRAQQSHEHLLMGHGARDFPEEGRYLESQRHVEWGTAVHSTHPECQAQP